jgi:hypothetical protein
MPPIPPPNGQPQQRGFIFSQPSPSLFGNSQPAPTLFGPSQQTPSLFGSIAANATNVRLSCYYYFILSLSHNRIQKRTDHFQQTTSSKQTGLRISCPKSLLLQIQPSHIKLTSVAPNWNGNYSLEL